MPKEQGRFGERVARSTSKNAKDKSNSATLRASQSGAHRELPTMGDMSNRMLRCDSEKDSEKDSGYSEAGSDSVHPDVDDRRSSVSEPQSGSSKGASGGGATGSGRSMPPYKDLSPVYVIKNLMVKPSSPDQLLRGPLAWGGGWHGLPGAKAPTQLLLIQQPAVPAPSSSALTPSSSVASPQNHARKGGGHGNKTSYLPILNSYPRIAPHPRKEGHGSKGASWVQGIKESLSEGHSQSKRVCTEEEKREAVSTTSHLLKPQHKDARGHSHSHSHSQCKGRSSSFPSSSHRPLHGQASSATASHRCQQSSSSDSISSPSVSSSQTPSPPCPSDSPSSSSPPSSSPSSSAAHSPYRLAPDSTSTRQRRFLNTAEILNQSGLLAITLRTKELLKQNAATEREIAQLRQHTDLLCQAAQARGGDGPDSLHKLVHVMTESGSYPGMDVNQLQTPSSSQQSKTQKEEQDARTSTVDPRPTLVSVKNVDDGTSPPSPLFAPSPETADPPTPLDPLSSSLSLIFSTSESKPGPRPAATDKDLRELCVLPESSTHNNYLF